MLGDQTLLCFSRIKREYVPRFSGNIRRDCARLEWISVGICTETVLGVRDTHRSSVRQSSRRDLEKCPLFSELNEATKLNNHVK